MDVGEFLKVFGPTLLGFILGIPSFYLARANLRKLVAEERKTMSEAQKINMDRDKSGAETADIYQKMASDCAVRIEEMNEKIDKLINDLQVERKHRQELETTVVRLTNELAREKKELENVKAWAEKLVAQLKEHGITPYSYSEI